MTMAEEEQRYRQKINNKVVNFGLIESILGMCFAFIIVICIIAAAIYLAINNHEWTASIMLGITATLAAIFYLKKEPTGKS